MNGILKTCSSRTRPPFRRRTTHENTISAGLMNMAMTGAGICWLPESLARDEMQAGRLVPASSDTGWNLDLEIRLYRHAATRNRKVEELWRMAQRLLENKAA